MGMMVDGVWKDEWYDTKSTGGRFQRTTTSFRNWITPDGAAGPTGEGGFKAESGRYHLYVSLACPWAHRTLIFRKLKKLEAHIGVSVVSWLMREKGWTFDAQTGASGDALFGAQTLGEVYLKADAQYTGRVTVPILWDKARGTIVNNESSEIIRMFNSAFDDLTGSNDDFYPRDLRGEIDEINELVYHAINNGVYKAGFATTQDAYEDAFRTLFAALDRVEEILSRQRYLCGDRITEADWRLLTTLVRFDPVYVGHFKCNLRGIVDYPNLWNYTRELAQTGGVMETIDLNHCKRHYYESHTHINPTGIVPLGPQFDLTAPHDRARLRAA